jgi:hypothetical protein
MLVLASQVRWVWSRRCGFGGSEALFERYHGDVAAYMRRRAPAAVAGHMPQCRLTLASGGEDEPGSRLKTVRLRCQRGPTLG